MNVDPSALAIVRRMEGKTITRAEFFDQRPDETWGDHDAVMLWLDDGSVVMFSSIGHDASDVIVTGHVSDAAYYERMFEPR